MTLKEASIKFNLPEKEIRKRINQGMLIKGTSSGKAAVPDDIAIIPSKQEIQAFLMQILQFKNNTSMVINRSLCPDEESFRILMDYMYNKGFIGKCTFQNNETLLLSEVQLTDDGFKFLFGNITYGKKANFTFTPLSINPNIKIGLVNIG